MCVSHTCIVLRKFVYYTWRFKKVYKSIYIHIYYNKADILVCPFTNCPSIIVSLNHLPPELLPQVAELVSFFCAFLTLCASFKVLVCCLGCQYSCVHSRCLELYCFLLYFSFACCCISRVCGLLHLCFRALCLRSSFFNEVL